MRSEARDASASPVVVRRQSLEGKLEQSALPIRQSSIGDALHAHDVAFGNGGSPKAIASKLGEDFACQRQSASSSLRRTLGERRANALSVRLIALLILTILLDNFLSLLSKSVSLSTKAKNQSGLLKRSSLLLIIHIINSILF